MPEKYLNDSVAFGHRTTHRDDNGTIAIHSFCQIIGKEISRENCLQTQGQTGCFGCASPARMCEECRMNGINSMVAVPAVGFCSGCITKMLVNERQENFRMPQFPQGYTVDCQVAKMKIDVAMCRAMQNKEVCRNCPAPSRVCEQCRNRPCKFPQYGLCLTCSIETYGEEWKTQKQEENFMTTTNSIDPSEQYTIPSHKDNSASVPLQVLPPHADQNLCARCGKHPIKVKTRQLCNSCAKKFYTERRRQKLRPPPKKSRAARRPQIARLLPEAKSLFIEKGKADVELLKRELHTGTETSAKILENLEQEGFLIRDPGLKIKRYFLAASAPFVVGDTLRTHMLKARDLIQTGGKATTDFLRQELRVSYETAAKLLKLLHEDGFLTQYIKDSSGRVAYYIGHQSETAEKLPPPKNEKLSLPEKITGLQELVNILGEKSKPAYLLRSIIADLRYFEKIKRTIVHFL